MLRRALPLLALAVAAGATPASAAGTGVSTGYNGVVTAAVAPSASLALSATCAFTVIGALDGDFHVVTTGVARTVTHGFAQDTTITCSVTERYGWGGSSTASDASETAVLMPSTTTVGQPAFHGCVEASTVTDSGNASTGRVCTLVFSSN